LFGFHLSILTGMSRGVPLRISDFEFRIFPYIPAMTFQERIDSDLKEAMKAKEVQRLGVIRMLKAALKNAAIEKYGITGQLDDAEAMVVVRKQVKQRQDSMESFIKGNRPELAEKENEELQLLNHYLPKQLGAEELTKLVTEAIAEAGATSKAQMGAVMKIAQGKAAGRVDGKALSQEVQRQLN
jgi:uncharacterized protein YqeY